MTTEHETMTNEHATNATTTEPYPIHAVFNLPIDELIIDPSKSLRSRPTDEEILRMAGSIMMTGQVQHVLVVWRGAAYELVTGYTRALAIRTHGDEFGIKKTIRAMSIRPEQVPLACLTDALVCRAPSTFEQARAFAAYAPHFESIRNLAFIVARSEEYVRGLIRIYENLPPNVREAWAADREHRFTYNRLTDLVRLSKKSDQVGMYRLLQKILSDPSKKRRDVPKLPFKTAQEHLIDAITGRGLDDEKKQKRHARRMSRGQMEKMEARLSAIAPQRLTQCTVSADMFRQFLSALLGKTDRNNAWSIVDGLVDNLERGHEVDQPVADVALAIDVSAPPQSAVVKDRQQPDFTALSHGELETLDGDEGELDQTVADVDPAADVSLAPPPESGSYVVKDRQQHVFTALPREESDALDWDDAEETLSEPPIQVARETNAGPSSPNASIAALSSLGGLADTQGMKPGAFLQAQLASLAQLTGSGPPPVLVSKMCNNPISQPLGKRKAVRQRPWTPTYADGSPRPKEPVVFTNEEFAALCLPDEDEDEQHP